MAKYKFKNLIFLLFINKNLINSVILNIYLYIIILKRFCLKNIIFWGLGIGDWGLGIGDWAQ